AAAEGQGEEKSPIDAGLDGFVQIQVLWPLLTRDELDLAWVQTLVNRFGIAKVREAFETCYQRGVHQDKLDRSLKGYLLSMCQNRNPDARNGHSRASPKREQDMTHQERVAWFEEQDRIREEKERQRQERKKADAEKRR
ncbi:MAG: hypothetical protein FJY95_23355, partial [Candidatus Handelsmanbacteria bacterium]|nr:hypothetical protein [Candidatus Handelsmanbacteria bacterium]